MLGKLKETVWLVKETASFTIDFTPAYTRWFVAQMRLIHTHLPEEMKGLRGVVYQMRHPRRSLVAAVEVGFKPEVVEQNIANLNKYLTPVLDAHF